MMQEASMTTKALFAQAEKQLLELQAAVAKRRNKDRACTVLTDLYVTVEGLARRIQAIEFNERAVCRDDEEDAMHEAGSDELTMSDLFTLPATEAELSEAERQAVDVREMRLFYFRLFIDYQVRGCKTIDDVLRKLLAFARRFRPEALEEFGLSMTAVGRRTGKSRQNIHAGEKRIVEKLLKESGAKGFHGLGGQKSEKHRAKCKAAQMGNTSRRTGEAKKRSA